MKNIEKYEHEISQLVNEGDDIECAIATAAGIIKENSCSTHDCKECQKKCLDWMYADYKEQILTDEEKDIIKLMIDVIHGFGYKAGCVSKEYYGENKDYIMIDYEDGSTINKTMISSPCFTTDKFIGMNPGKEYTLEELGI